MKKCIQCGNEINDNAKFCGFCGAKQQEQKKFCENCGAIITNLNFCENCGAKVGGTQPEATVMPEKQENAFGFDFGFGDSLNQNNYGIDNMLNSRMAENMLKIFEYVKLDENEFAITGLKNKLVYNIEIPDCVVSIEDNAFENSNITSVTISESVRKIGKRAFANSKHLEKANIPQKLMEIGDEAFCGCENLEIVIPKNIKIVGKDIAKNTITENKEKEKQEKLRIEQEKIKKENLKQVKELKALNAEYPKKSGKYVIFGNFPQSGSKPEPIKWQILDEKNDKVLLLSEKILKTGIYDKDNNNYAYSEVRKWLIETFLEEAFTSNQQKLIEKKLINVNNIKNNVKINDKVFLLTRDEVSKYFKSSDDKRKHKTKYANNFQSFNEEDFFGWWLRNTKEASIYANFIGKTGADYYAKEVYEDKFGIVPAILIKKENIK